MPRSWFLITIPLLKKPEMEHLLRFVTKDLNQNYLESFSFTSYNPQPGDSNSLSKS